MRALQGSLPAELPHPLIYSEPPTQAAGQEYRYDARSLRSLGDLQYRECADRRGERRPA